MPETTNQDPEKIKERRKRNQPKTPKGIEGRKRRAKARHARLVARALAGDLDAARMAGWKCVELTGNDISEIAQPINSSSVNMGDEHGK